MILLILINFNIIRNFYISTSSAIICLYKKYPKIYNYTLKFYLILPKMSSFWLAPIIAHNPYNQLIKASFYKIKRCFIFKI